MNVFTEMWNRFWFAPTAAWPLGLCRAGFFAAFYLLYLYRWDQRVYAFFPDGFFQPRSFFVWRSLAPVSEVVFTWLVTGFEYAVLLSALGIFTRLSTAASFTLGLYVIGYQFNYGYLHWAHAVVPLVMGVLALAPSGDAWSVDGLLFQRVARRGKQVGGQYHWPMQLVRLIFVSIFLAAGLSKLRAAGLSWVTSDTLQHYILENQYIFQDTSSAAWERAVAAWLVRTPILCQILAGLSLTLELSAPAALFSHRARIILIPSLFVFQVGNAFLLYQNFFFAYLGLYAFWIPWQHLHHIIIDTLQPRNR
ncbi:hypothetical protein C2W62_02635 [Candidatus Entotheonella serta]|nr:hypothetical protein C2W62_02635 [Candidatus Entotheonella serta]